jgi:hypothetical protein
VIDGRWTDRASGRLGTLGEVTDFMTASPHSALPFHTLIHFMVASSHSALLFHTVIYLMVASPHCIATLRPTLAYPQ